MKILLRVLLITCVLIPVSACRADEGVKNILYAVKSYDRWPILVFVESPNIPPPWQNYTKYAAVRSGGYDSSNADSLIRNIKRNPSDPETMLFYVTWYEIVTKKAYSAEISVDLRTLKADAIRPEFGVLIFRIARKGEFEVLTYDDDYPSRRSGPDRILLSQVCGKEIALLDPEKLSELDRMLNEPMTMEGGAFDAKPEEVPSRCE